MKENRVLEFKECITNTFLKTVSAFANFGTGKIYFGVNDTGRDVGKRLALILKIRLMTTSSLSQIFPFPLMNVPMSSASRYWKAVISHTFTKGRPIGDLIQLP